MKKIKNIIFLFILGIVPLMAGCQTTNIIGDYVQDYCTKPKAERVQLRDTFAALITPNKVVIDCAVDHVQETIKGDL